MKNQKNLIFITMLLVALFLSGCFNNTALNDDNIQNLENEDAGEEYFTAEGGEEELLPIEIGLEKIEEEAGMEPENIEDEQEAPDNSNENKQNPEIAQYKNEVLKISFSYPKTWGEIEQFSYSGDTTEVTLSVLGDFLVANNGKPTEMPRGIIWNYMPGDISDQGYIDRFCLQKTKAKSCELKKNKSGIKYARVEEEIRPFMEEPIMETSYYMFNPNSEYKGIVIYKRILASNKIDNLDEKLDSLVESLKFLK